MSQNFKIIQDPVHGPVRVSGIIGELIDTPEFQRLRYVKQLGMSYLVYPGANHTRFEHSLGTMFVASQFAERLEIDQSDMLLASALLHDLGHPPFSHSFEDLFQSWTGLDHAEAGRRIILGKKPFTNSGIPGILEKYGLDAVSVSKAASGSKDLGVVSAIISGPVDADELDYLNRDSIFCGIPLGLVDYKRILNTLIRSNNRLSIEEKGIPNLESLLIGRILMYRSVYWHKTSRIIHGMMSTIVSPMKEEIENPFLLNDGDLLTVLLSSEKARPRMKEVLMRRLFKKAAVMSYSPDILYSVKESMSGRFDPDDYIIDVIPPPEFQSPDRIKTDFEVIVGGVRVPLLEASPLAESLARTVAMRKIVVSCHGSILEKITGLLSRYAKTTSDA